MFSTKPCLMPNLSLTPKSLVKVTMRASEMHLQSIHGGGQSQPRQRQRTAYHVPMRSTNPPLNVMAFR